MPTATAIMIYTPGPLSDEAFTLMQLRLDALLRKHTEHDLEILTSGYEGGFDWTGSDSGGQATLWANTKWELEGSEEVAKLLSRAYGRVQWDNMWDDEDGGAEQSIYQDGNRVYEAERQLVPVDLDQLVANLSAHTSAGANPTRGLLETARALVTAYTAGRN